MQLDRSHRSESPSSFQQRDTCLIDGHAPPATQHRHRPAVKPFAVVLSAAGVELDRAEKLARRLGRTLRLGSAELQLLELFMSYQGVVFTREQLVAILWGARADIVERTVDQKIARLRRVLTLGHAPDPICCVRGKGYKFSETAEEEYALWLQHGPAKLRLSVSS